jgi:predicted DNA-binding protein with PD1-like motif
MLIIKALKYINQTKKIMLKKISLLIVTIIFLISCRGNIDKTITTTFYSQDSTYKITFEKPIELDTLNDWIDTDDNACSFEHKYRFSKKTFPHQLESGFFWTSYVDSTYRITLKHIEGFRCKSDIDNDIMNDTINYLKHLYNDAKILYPKINIDTLNLKKIRVNNRNFILYSYRIKEDFHVTKNFTNGYWTNYLVALTEIDGNLLDFTADCRSNNCDGFIQKMEKSLETIMIENTKFKALK